LKNRKFAVSASGERQERRFLSSQLNDLASRLFINASFSVFRCGEISFKERALGYAVIEGIWLQHCRDIPRFLFSMP